MNKKSQSGADTIFTIATIFGLAVFTLVLFYTYNAFQDIAQTSEVINSSTPAMNVINDAADTNEMWDYFILAILIGFAIAMIISGYFVDVHTIFFVVYLIVLLVGMMLAGVLSYAWEYISGQGVFTTIASTSYPITNHIISNLHLYYIIVGGLALLATYAKTKNQDAF